MKLVIMKLVCLAALLSGIFVLGLVFDVAQMRHQYDQAMELWPRQVDGSLNLRLPGTVAGLLLVIAGGYGLLPQLRRRKKNVITYRGTHGDIVLELKPLRKVLLKMMRKMPEVYSIKLAVKPDADGRRACIIADVVLKNSAALGARRCAKMVGDCLSATARDVLGLEDLSMVRVNVKGVHVDIIATGRQMREQLALREEDDQAAYALAHPPAASVTLDEHSTDNRPPARVDGPDEDDAAELAPGLDNADVTEEEPSVDAVEAEAESPGKTAPGTDGDTTFAEADETTEEAVEAEVPLWTPEPTASPEEESLATEEPAPAVEEDVQESVTEEDESWKLPETEEATDDEVVLPPLMDKEEEEAPAVEPLPEASPPRRFFGGFGRRPEKQPEPVEHAEPVEEAEEVREAEAVPEAVEDTSGIDTDTTRADLDPDDELPPEATPIEDNDPDKSW